MGVSRCRLSFKSFLSCRNPVLSFTSYAHGISIPPPYTQTPSGIACHIYHFRYFLLKREITFEVATFGGSLNSGGRYFRDLLTPVKFYCYFQRVATFGGLLLSELYSTLLGS